MLTKAELIEVLKTDPGRFPMPQAYVDPAFQRCIVESSDIPELVENFDRLTGCKIGRISTGSVIEKMVDSATGFRDDQLRQFAEFVHQYVYMLLPNEAIHALRLTALDAD